MRSALGQMPFDLLYNTILCHQNLEAHLQMTCSGGATKIYEVPSGLSY